MGRSPREIETRFHDWLHGEVKDLRGAEYRDALERIQGHVEASLEAIDEERKDAEGPVEHQG